MNSIHRNYTLATHEQADAVSRILQAALNAADPVEAIRRTVQRQENHLLAGDVTYDLSTFPKIHLLSIGKAGGALALALEQLLGGFLTRGLVITKAADQPSPKSCETRPLRRCTVILGAHPIPDERSLAAGEAVLNFLREIGPNDLLICAISGGGSALMAAPRDSIKLTDLQSLTANLLACGATIHEINTLRRHLDILKRVFLK